MIDVEDLIALVRNYNPRTNEALIRRAYDYGRRMHEGQKRRSGEDYFTHPVAVAAILTEQRLDDASIITALLHDTIEDTKSTFSEVSAQFGEDIAELVDGVTKLTNLQLSSTETKQSENFRKLFMAMSKDLRVILVKLADRLHNMRTLDAMPHDKSRRIAKETLEIYAPIANRLGMHSMYAEFEDLGFKAMYPMRSAHIRQAVKRARGNRKEIVAKIEESIRHCLEREGLQGEVSGREKHLYSIYQKMRGKRKAFNEIMDVYAFRIVVDKVDTCYRVLGAVHNLYKPLPGRFKDYIAIPKANGYQSLHTTLFGMHGVPIEIQIRTHEMEELAKHGIAAHWLYKSSEEDAPRGNHARARQWVKGILELQQRAGNSLEFIESVKIDLFPDEVYVFTPKGRIMELPKGSTAVDFAYAVHTDIGNRCVASRVNGDLVPLRTELRNGDQVEIITASQAGPNPAWLSYVRTGKARAQIRHFLKNAQQDESVALGERLLNQALRAHGLNLGQISTFAWDRFLRDRGVRQRREIFADLGLGKRLPVIVARRLAEAQDLESGRPNVIKPKPASAVLIRGSEGAAVQLARCCHPIPGDEIIATIRKGQGLEVHVHDCAAVARLRSDRGRWIDVGWEPADGRLFEAAIRVLTIDKRGVLARVAAAISDAEANILNVTMDTDHAPYTALQFNVEVADRKHLARLIRNVRVQTAVTRVFRQKSEVKR